MGCGTQLPEPPSVHTPSLLPVHCFRLQGCKFGCVPPVFDYRVASTATVFIFGPRLLVQKGCTVSFAFAELPRVLIFTLAGLWDAGSVPQFLLVPRSWHHSSCTTGLSAWDVPSIGALYALMAVTLYEVTTSIEGIDQGCKLSKFLCTVHACCC